MATLLDVQASDDLSDPGLKKSTVLFEYCSDCIGSAFAAAGDA